MVITVVNNVLVKDKFLFFDGAMGTMLQANGLKAGEIPEIYNITHPHIVQEIHEKYLLAGSDIITTNTFGANELKFKDTEYTASQIIEAAVKNARISIEGLKNNDKKRYIALDIGPIGQLLEPMGTLKFEEAYEIFKTQVVAGVNAGADVILIETMADTYEVKAAVLAAKENSSLPVFCTMTFGEDGRTLTGADPVTMVALLEGLKVDALGVNCSLGPKELLPIVEKILEYASIPVMVQANAGIPTIENGKTVFRVMPEEFTMYVKKMAELGVTVIGGCCGTTDKYIKTVMDELVKLKPKEITFKNHTLVSSGVRTAILGEGVNPIGERINPTGKKKLKEALKNNDLDYLLTEAINQKEAGAKILDVNVGLPEIDECKLMKKAIKEIQAIVDLPLQIDSVVPEVIENAVRIYNGKPIINSVNGKNEIMESIFPIAKKYGAVVVGLALDKNGIPPKAEQRLEIAQKIVEKAKEYGIDKKDIIIDCLVLTASFQQEESKETIKAVTLVKEELGVKTVLGVSNVSFGFPARQNLNKTYLAMTLYAGLDAPIINPLAEGIMETIAAFNVLTALDKEGTNYIKKYGDIKEEKVPVGTKLEKNLKEIVISGLKEEATNKTKELLKTVDSMDIINEFLIPALDVVGQRYERGELFLPQLIQSAETVKNSFAVIKDEILKSGEVQVSKGKVILATVYGDIHDIGKNIVKVLLQNYGFDVVDLGKDVPIELVVETAKKENIKLIGLSALMTMTVKNMEATIEALRKANLGCTVFVGGAVLNQEYADMIGADFYAKDARVSVNIAREFYGV